MNKAWRGILSIVVLVVVAGGSFYGGTAYQKGNTPQLGAARRQGQFPGQVRPDAVFPGSDQQGAAGRAGALAGMTFGQIEEIGEGVMTITDNNGNKTQVHVTDTTLIEKQASVKLTDLAKGETVIVSGSKADDGSITARSVQVGSAGRFGIANPGTGSNP